MQFPARSEMDTFNFYDPTILFIPTFFIAIFIQFKRVRVYCDFLT